MAIRAADPSDAPQIAALVNLAFRVERFFVYGYRTNADQISAMFQTGTFLLAEIASQPLGCVYLELRGDRAYFGLLSLDRVHQDQGVGRELVGLVARRARCRLQLHGYSYSECPNRIDSDLRANGLCRIWHSALPRQSPD